MKKVYEIKKVLNKEKWNQTAMTFPEANFLNSWGWVEFELAMNQEFIPYGVSLDDKLIGLLPVNYIKAKRGNILKLDYSPLIDWQNTELVSTVFDFLKKEAKNSKMHLIRLNPNLEITEENRTILDSLELKDSSSSNTEQDFTLILDLEKSEEELLAEMRKNTRYSIKKANKLGVTISKTSDMKRFDEFWDIFIDAAVRNNWKQHYSKIRVKTQFEIFAKRGEAHMYFAEYEDVSIATGIFMNFNNKSIYLHSGSLSEYRNIPSMYLILWEAILDAKKNGSKEFNLWGISEQNDTRHPWYGLSLFKRGFGGNERRRMHSQDFVVNPFAHILRTYEKVENLRKGF